MNIEPDIFDYLETTSLEPHDDYTSEITYKDQKIIWNKLKEQDKEIERLKEMKLNTEKYASEMEDKYILEKNKNNKAIEYIENYLCSDEYIQSDINSIANAFVKLVDILKGVNKE